jgi:hypothetical protein
MGYRIARLISILASAWQAHLAIRPIPGWRPPTDAGHEIIKDIVYALFRRYRDGIIDRAASRCRTDIAH